MNPFLLDAVARRVPAVFGTDLVVKEKSNPSEILLNGWELGKCIHEAALRYRSPLAFPYMDLKVEKEFLLHLLGIHGEQADTFQFDGNLGNEIVQRVRQQVHGAETARMRANCDAIRYIGHETDYQPIGLAIGPYSLMTKLFPEPITPVYLSSMGVQASEDLQVQSIELALEISTTAIERSVALQLQAGAKAIVICEPAANKVFISPDTLTEEPGDVFDRYVISFNKRIAQLIASAGADLFFHNCGELTGLMIKKMCGLKPAVLSLGSSRKLWEDAAFVDRDIILFGNLPTKQFFLEEAISSDQVEAMTNDLYSKMEETGHLFICGSECDVLLVEGYEHIIHNKLMRLVTCCR